MGPSPGAVLRQPGGTRTADPVQEAIDQAAARFPPIAPDLAQVTLRGTVQDDRTIVRVDGRGTFTYPSQIRTAQAGFYAYKWDADGNHHRTALIDLATGDIPAVVPQIAQAAGEKELRELRKQRR